MIVKINIIDEKNDEEKYIIQWDNIESQGPVLWGVPGASDELIARLEKYFTTPQEYYLPMSEESDEYEKIKAIPIDKVEYFEMALSELYVTTGIKLGKVVK